MKTPKGLGGMRGGNRSGACLPWTKLQPFWRHNARGVCEVRAIRAGHPRRGYRLDGHDGKLGQRPTEFGSWEARELANRLETSVSRSLERPSWKFGLKVNRDSSY